MAPTSASSFLVTVQILALDRNGLLSDITRSIADEHISISAASVHTHRDRTAKTTLTFETPDPTHLDHVLNAIRRVPGVYDVNRVQG
jgi:GTP pyrophosphokinase